MFSDQQLHKVCFYINKNINILSEKQKRKRSRNFSTHEKEILCRLIFPKNDIVRSKSADKKSKELRKRTWYEIFEDYKKLVKNTERTLDQIKVYWKNQLSKKPAKYLNNHSIQNSNCEIFNSKSQYFNNDINSHNTQNYSSSNNAPKYEHQFTQIENKCQNNINLWQPCYIQKYIDCLRNYLLFVDFFGNDKNSIIEKLIEVNKTIDYYNNLVYRNL